MFDPFAKPKPPRDSWDTAAKILAILLPSLVAGILVARFFL